MLYIGIIILIFLIEFKIKNHMDHELVQGERKKILNGKIILQKYRNKGACLNLLSKRPKIVVIISVVFSLLLFLYFIFSLGTRGNKLLRIGLAFLIGGSFSNTYDRLKKKYVVDYFSFQTKSKKINAVVFNLADFCILIGAMLAAIGS